MNNKPLAGLALVILLSMPLSALAEATAGEAVWTPPVVTAEEMEAARLGERIVMRGQEGDDVRLVQQDRKSTRLNSSHGIGSRMPSSA